MQLISPSYVSINKELHGRNKHYGTSGMRHIDKIVKLVKQLQTQDILDYGCGKSSLARNLPFDIKQYDPAISKYAELPEPADIVVCTDVLEHIEPEYLDNVLAHIAKLTKNVCYLTACLQPAHKTLEDGRNAHLIQQTALWWFEKLTEFFDIQSFADQKEEIVVVVKPKKQELTSA